MNPTLGRIIGGLSAISSGALVTYYVSYNWSAIADFLGSIGGIGPLLIALACAAVAIGANIWLPGKWPGWVRAIIRVAVLILAVAFGSPVVAAIFAQSSWLALLGVAAIILGTVVWGWIIFSLILTGRPFARRIE